MRSTARRSPGCSAAPCTTGPLPLRADSNAGLPAKQTEDALHGWLPAPGHYQTTQLAGYRFGGDGAAGPTALVSVTGPSTSYGAVFRLVADIGLSLVDGVDAVLLGQVLRDALVSLGDTAALVLDDLLPPGAEATRADAHWTVPIDDGAGQHRPVPARAALDVSLFGTPSRPLTADGAYAEVWNGPVAAAAAAGFAHRALTRFALDSGYLDPTAGLDALLNALHPA